MDAVTPRRSNPSRKTNLDPCEKPAAIPLEKKRGGGFSSVIDFEIGNVIKYRHAVANRREGRYTAGIFRGKVIGIDYRVGLLNVRCQDGQRHTVEVRRVVAKLHGQTVAVMA